MTQSESLRKRQKQHKVKNGISKQEDKTVRKAANRTIEYLRKRFEDFLKPPNTNVTEFYDLEFRSGVTYDEMFSFMQRSGAKRSIPFDESLRDSFIRPDGGIIWLQRKRLVKSEDGSEETIVVDEWPLVFSEVKRQGTNDERLKEGLGMQSVGNALERFGKNLIGIRTMMKYENVTPVVCFGDGCDFASQEDVNAIAERYGGSDERKRESLKRKFASGAKTMLAKASMLNEFYPLNKIFVFKQDRNSEFGPAAPITMMLRYKRWTEDEMFEIMKEIAETTFRYYAF